MVFGCFELALALLALAAGAHAEPARRMVKPFMIKSGTAYIIGNDVWNLTIDARGFGKKLMYLDTDLVGRASGHYVSYNGATSNLSWNYKPPKISDIAAGYTDIVFSAKEGDLHWILKPGLHGAYQYFVNRALPVLGEFRTLWRLDNRTFTYGWTNERDERLVPLSDIRNAASEKVQDETWERADGSFITKYDLATFMPVVEGEPCVWGLHGTMKKGDVTQGIGSFYIHGGKDYLNGDHMKQELMIHRESSSGDSVQLNMLHGTHFQSSSKDKFEPGRTWGPWLWYLNNGSSADAVERAVAELSNWPYSWMADTGGYMERGSIKGRIRLTDGRPASGAAIFLGDNRPNKTTLTQGSGYYYRTYADRNGAFKLSHVRGGLRNLQAWPNGGPIGDVTTVFSMNDVRVTPGAATDLGELAWMPQRRVRMVWQIGELDRTAKGFGLSGPPHEHARSRKCPANLVFEVGRSDTKDWCFAQVHPGVWSIRFNVDNSSMVDAALTISLAAYTSGVSAMVSLNDRAIGQMNIRNIGAGDPALFRSGTLAGEWHMVRVPINGTLWRPGPNKIDIRIRSGKGLWTASDTKILSKNPWRGFMYDSLLLELED